MVTWHARLGHWSSRRVAGEADEGEVIHAAGPDASCRILRCSREVGRARGPAREAPPTSMFAHGIGAGPAARRTRNRCGERR